MLLFKIGCESAVLIEKNGFLYQTGGPIENKIAYCKSPDNGGFALPYEVGFVVNFTSINSKPRGCGVLDLHYLWRPHGQEPWKNQIYPGKMTKLVNFFSVFYVKGVLSGAKGEGGSTNCGRNVYAPEGTALADIVDSFAKDSQAWQETFFNAWEKMQINGYELDDLTVAPPNGNLIAGVSSFERQ